MMQKVWRIFVGIAGGLVAAILAFRPLFYAFLRNYPDCAPNQVDGNVAWHHLWTPCMLLAWQHFCG